MTDDTNSDVANYLTNLRKDIDQRIVRFFESGEAGQGLPLSSHAKDALQLLEEFTLRPGKRIRGALAAVSYQMFGGTNRQTALDLALAMELTQAYLLIIDDVMDRSPLRRGGLSMHRLFADKIKDVDAESIPGPKVREHLGNMLAINTGLIAQHLASGILAATGEHSTRVVETLDLFHTNLIATCFGQNDDLYNHDLEAVTEDDIKRMYELKSSYYTFINPLQTGAALAGATAEDRKICHKIGMHAGLAFQLQDDMIGMYGEAKITGKSALDDLQEGKQTLLVHYALEHASPEEIAIIKAALGNPDLTEDDHLKVQNILTASGARYYVVTMVAQETAEALKILEAQTRWKSDGIELLTALLHQMTERKV